MRIHGSIYRITVLLIALLFVVGCLGGKKVAEEESQRPSSAGVDKRGFDPLELPEDREVIPLTHPKSGDIQGQTAFVEADNIGADTSLSQQTATAGEIDSLNNQAFRIQLLTSKVYGDARYALHVAEEIFDYPVFMDYEVPYFKVRVGSFAERDDAEEYLMKVKSAGYTDAWVVMVNVRVKETAPLYDDLLIPSEADSLLPEIEELTGDDEP